MVGVNLVLSEWVSCYLAIVTISEVFCLMRYGSVQNAEIHLFCSENRNFFEKNSSGILWRWNSQHFACENMVKR